MKDCVSKKITIYGFAMTMIIMVYHWNNFYSMAGVEGRGIHYLTGFVDLMGHVAMGFFFMMSGYLLYLNADSPTDMVKKMKRRMYSLLLPLVIWNTLTLVYEILLHFAGVLPAQWSVMTVVNGYTFRMFCGVLWYLLALMLLMLPSPLIIRLKRSRLLSFAFCGMAVCVRVKENTAGKGIFGALRRACIVEAAGGGRRVSSGRYETEN